MANQKLGVYFGRNRVNLVESCGTKVLNSIFVPADILADSSKAIEAIQAAIKDNKIKAKRRLSAWLTTTSLSGALRCCF